MKVIGSSPGSHKQKRSKSLLSQCKTSIDNNVGFIKTKSREVGIYHGVFGYGGSSGVTAIFVAYTGKESKVIIIIIITLTISNAP